MTLSLARRADRFPERTAVVDISEERLYAPAETIHEHRVSYGELSAMATRTAEHLSALGVESGDVVALVTRNRVASLALLFACRRLGAALFPISHLLTPASVERPFDAVDPDLVVSEAAQRDLVRSIPYDRSVTLEELADADRDEVPDDVGHGGDADTDTVAGSDAPLLLLHGEDGRPVTGYSERTLEWNCISTLVAWGVSAADTAPLTRPLSTPDGLVRVALSLLYVGGTLLLDRAFDPGDALTAIDEEAATLLAGSETTITDIASESGFADAVDSLERVIVEGAVENDVRAAYRDRGIPVARAYGRLECPTAFSQPFAGDTDVDIDGDATAAAGVGTPVPDCRVRLIDDSGTVLGDEGENEDEAETETEGRLQLSGPVVADGYVNAAGTDEENWYDSAEVQSTDYDEDGSDGRGRYVDGWFDTGERFRRGPDGSYDPQ